MIIIDISLLFFIEKYQVLYNGIVYNITVIVDDNNSYIFMICIKIYFIKSNFNPYYSKIIKNIINENNKYKGYIKSVEYI